MNLTGTKKNLLKVSQDSLHGGKEKYFLTEF